ncbi:Disease resistance protein [Quillaja saponaria]|uniref:Disease resistance protein n=1 Tax=Quillaja saponaria TaxID=32244 RepID=A0AAD7M3D7_QUISA|nr:Disease resistance protein [Quillaja saponaria]
MEDADDSLLGFQFSRSALTGEKWDSLARESDDFTLRKALSTSTLTSEHGSSLATYKRRKTKKEYWEGSHLEFKQPQNYAHQDLEELNKKLEVSILKLKRKMESLNLMLSYPAVLLGKDRSKVWVKDVLKVVSDFRMRRIPHKENGQLLARAEDLIRHYDHLIESFIPVDITEKMDTVGKILKRDINLPRPQTETEFGQAGLVQSQQAELTDGEKLHVPQPILKLALDLAVQQLLQNLVCGDMHYIRVSARSNGNILRDKIQQALKGGGNLPAGTFVGVVFVDVSQFPSNAQVQQELAQLMQLQCNERSDSFLLKTRIQEELRSKRYLVVLDNADGLDLHKIGIPTENFAGVLVCITGAQYSDMTMDLEIRTEDHLLSWELFCKNVGSKLVHSSSDIQNMAIGIVEECCGHLLAILLMASSLKNVEDVKFWELALEKLQCINPVITQKIDGSQTISRVMINALMNVVWEHMHNDAKHCLMCCLLRPNVTKMIESDVLISNWIYIGYEGKHILEELLNSFLLLGLNSKKSLIRMPEETYGILKLLDRSDSGLSPLYLKQAGFRLTEPPKGDQWNSASEIHLMDNKFSELPGSPYCPELRVLFLQGNAELAMIPTFFFDYMPVLHVLDLSYTSIRSLPKSISKLVALREFLLRGCELFMELPPEIGQLKNLEKLDLDGTQITNLPREIENLTNLKSLALSFFSYAIGRGMQGMHSNSIISPGVILNLFELIELSIDVSPDDQRWSNNVEVVIREICGLRDLKTLKLYIPEVQLLQRLSECSSLFLERTRFHFSFIVGHHMERIISRVPPEVEAEFKTWDKSLKFVNGVSVPGEVKMVLKHGNAFFLDRHMSITKLSEFGFENLKWVKFCLLAECNEMQTIFDGGDINQERLEFPGALSNLEYLRVYYMKSLKSIWEGPIDKCSLRYIRLLALHTCPELRTIFTPDVLANLHELEELIVEDCPKLSSLVSTGSFEPKGEVFLPWLKTVYLLYLPELVSISNGVLIGPQLERIGFYNCPKLERLSTAELSSKKLKLIKGEKEWWEELQWSESEWGQGGCPDNLKGIFSPIDEEADVMTQFQIDKVLSVQP